jgi:hypothetical protein
LDDEKKKKKERATVVQRSENLVTMKRGRFMKMLQDKDRGTRSTPL